jgi:hypothetical protein
MSIRLKKSVLALSLWSIALSAYATTAESTKELEDEIRATIVKELAIMKRYGDSIDTNQQNGTGGQSDGAQVRSRRRSSGNIVQVQDNPGPSRGNSDGGCHMDVGSQDAQNRRSGIRRVTTVVTGSVIQMCK